MAAEPASRQKLTARLILGSGSPRRLDLLKQAGLPPDLIAAADIDETPYKNELPRQYVLRMAEDKNAALAELYPDDYILTADTTCIVGRRILGKPETPEEAEAMLRLLSGRNHRIYTAVTVRAPDGRTASRINETRVKSKHIDDADIAEMVAEGDWKGRCGGYSYAGKYSRYIQQIVGSSTGILGLPMYETTNLLIGLGYKVKRHVSDPA